MPLEEELLAGYFVFTVCPAGTYRRLIQEQERGLDRHHRSNLLDRDKLSLFRQSKSPNFAINEGLHVTHRAQIPQFIIVDRKLEHVFDQNHDFHHREGINPQVFNQPEVIIRVL